jgi:hypothetical protein
MQQLTTGHEPLCNVQLNKIDHEYVCDTKE